MNSRLALWGLAVGAIAAGVAWRANGLAQQSATDQKLREAYASQPGGTAEEHLWEVLFLMGVGDREPAKWDGSLRVSGGEVYALEGYRFELPDRVLPQGGWRMSTRRDRILEHSGLDAPGGAGGELQILPKGLLIRGSGSPSAAVVVDTPDGSCSLEPMQMRFGQWQGCLAGRATYERIPAETDLSGTVQRQHDFPSIGAGNAGQRCGSRG